MAKFEIEFDASSLVKAFNKGIETAFLIIHDEFPELDQQLNLNNIDSEDNN